MRLSDPARFRCGATTCRSGTESCCSDGKNGGCVPTVPSGPQDESQYLATQMMACGDVSLEFSLNQITRCDESVDCERSEVCCTQFLFSGAHADVCIPLGKPEHDVCDAGERCIAGERCRTPGAECIEGHCSKPCREPSRCGRENLRCSGPSDCLKGQHCALTFVGSRCSGLLDTANTEIVCESDADCPTEMLCENRPRCVPSGRGPLQICACG